MLRDGYMGQADSIKAAYADKKVGEIAFPEGVGSEALGTLQGHLQAKDNIWTAIACLCPTAILINLKKLKTIYEVHNCCIEQACKSGGSTEPCEKALSEQLCMYWEGSLLQTIVGMVLGILTMIISKIIGALIKKYLSFLTPLLNCLAAVLEVAQIPQNIKNLQAAWEELSDADFKSVDCDDLDTSAVGEFQPRLRERYENTEIWEFNLDLWTEKKQEAENEREQALMTAPEPIDLDSLDAGGEQEPDVERAEPNPEFRFPTRRVGEDGQEEAPAPETPAPTLGPTTAPAPPPEEPPPVDPSAGDDTDERGDDVE